MELTLVTLVPADPSAGHLPPDDALLLGLLRSAARPEERLEHISVRSGPYGVDLGLFTVATPGRSAREAAIAVCRRALVAPSPFHGWLIATGPARLARPAASPTTT
ncbi:hypothetical protein ACIPRL_05105 [Streptomyces sp. NPDC090085]|uniref:hypothetical protein n=1 Tax=Streptomyces sp. NPDC090085 TaxID=3365943 RepID=UPI0038101DFB